MSKVFLERQCVTLGLGAEVFAVPVAFVRCAAAVERATAPDKKYVD